MATKVGDTVPGLYRYQTADGREVQYGDPTINKGALTGAKFLGRQGDPNATDPLAVAPASGGGTSTVRRYTSDLPAGSFGVELNADGTPKTFGEADAQAIRDKTAAEMAARLNAVEEIFKPRIAAEEQAGRYRVGQTRAYEARGGLIGSPRGGAQGAKTEGFNKQLMDQLMAEKGQAIQAVYDKIDSRADERIAAERERVKGNIDAYFAYLEKNKTGARDDIKTLASGGIPLDQLDEADVLDLMKDAGFDSRVLFDSFYNSQKPAPLKVKYTYDTRKDGTVIRMGDDGTVKIMDDIKLPPEIDAQFITADNGDILFVDKNDPVNADGSAKYKSLGNFAKPKDGGGSGEDSINNLDRSAPDFMQKVLQGSKGGKPPTVTERTALSKGFNVINQIGTLQSLIGKEQTGPILGTIRGNNPYDEKAQAISAQLTSIVPNLARGVYGEVGVLTDADIANYSKTLPNLKSTEAVRNAILGLTLRSVLNSIDNQLEVSAASGLDVSGFESKYTDLQNRVKAIEKEIGVTSGQKVIKAVGPDGDVTEFDELDEADRKALKEAGYTITE